MACLPLFFMLYCPKNGFGPECFEPKGKDEPMKRFVILLAAALLMLAAGCSQPPETITPPPVSTEGGTSASPTEATPTLPLAPVETQPAGETPAAPVEVVGEVPTEPPPGAPQFNDAEALQSLSSYRSRIISRTEIQGSPVRELYMQQDETGTPRTRYTFVQDTTTDEPSTLEMYTINDFEYLNVGDGWMITQIDPTDEEGASFADTGVLSFADISQSTQESAYEYVGQENRNGINTSHYRLNMTADQVLALAESLTEISEYNAELWVANQPGLPVFTVFFLVQINGKANDAPASFTMTQEVYDINQPFSLSVPPEALQSGLPADIPPYPGMTAFSAMEGFVSFSAPDDMAVVQGFYENSLAANGWSAGERTDLDNMIILTWTKDNRTVEISLSGREGGGSEVMIMLGLMEEE